MRRVKIEKSSVANKVRDLPILKDMTFTIWDIGVIKIYLGTVGLVAGAFFSEFILKFLWIFLGVIGLAGIYLVPMLYRHWFK